MNEIDNKKMVDDTYEFNVDDQNQHILYTNNDYESKLIDFNGTSLKKNVDNYGNAYFIDGSYTIVNMMESIRQTLVVMRENLYKQQVIFIVLG